MTEKKYWLVDVTGLGGPCAEFIGRTYEVYAADEGEAVLRARVVFEQDMTLLAAEGSVRYAKSVARGERYNGERYDWLSSKVMEGRQMIRKLEP